VLKRVVRWISFLCFSFFVCEFCRFIGDETCFCFMPDGSLGCVKVRGSEVDLLWCYLVFFFCVCVVLVGQCNYGNMCEGVWAWRQERRLGGAGYVFF